MERYEIGTFAPTLSEIKDPTAGYFTAVRLDDFSEASLKASTMYSRKDFYKISLISGHTIYHSGNQSVEVHSGEWYLVFTNCERPYRWEPQEGKCKGYSCMFTENFLPLHTHIRPSDWDVFNGNSESVLKLSEHEKNFFTDIFSKMLIEQNSDYNNKYDLLFIYVLECIHGAMKLQPPRSAGLNNAASNLAKSFTNLLSSQFPLSYPDQSLKLKSAGDFADRLAVHTNYLNRSLKEVTGKTTTQLIMERFMQEAQALLLHSSWSINQIGAVFGFEEQTHFARTFKKHTGQTPKSMRK